MKPHQRLFRRSLVTVLVAAAAGLASFSMSAATANAAEYHYCFGVPLGGGAHCTGPRHTLTRNSAIGPWTGVVCVFATTTSGGTTPEVCGLQNATQGLCGCQLMYPAFWDGYQAGAGLYYGFMEY